MAATPGALQLRLLQTVVDVAAERNSTLVMPFPVELLRFFDRGSAAPAQAAAAGAAESAPAPAQRRGSTDDVTVPGSPAEPLRRSVSRP